tara:strand:- start:121 stop:810 length:690 start_codon:yes stop_codon:yes gene_type:complete
MNKNILLNYLFCSLCFVLFACSPTKLISQSNTLNSENTYFEGRIIYDLSYLPKTSNIKKDQADIFFGNKQTYTIKDNMYKNEMNGTLKMSQHYLGNDTLFISTAKTQDLLWVDTTYINDKIISIEITENVEVINGILCDLLTINSNNGYFKYYYNSSYKINPENYVNHKVGFWNVCVDQTKSIMLKSILDTKDEHIELNAIDIQEMVIEESEFELPNLPRKRFPIKKKN